MRRAGRSAATILDRLCSLVRPGMSTLEVDEAGGQLMKDMGVKSAQGLPFRPSRFPFLHLPFGE